MPDIFLDIGYTVDMTYDGLGALELSGRHQYRLALLDYKMPDIDVCRCLKNSQQSRERRHWAALLKESGS
jgi:CheY-like chemotaxis protein